MKNYYLSLLFMVTMLSANEINIAVAANVSYAIQELQTEFAKLHPDTDVRVTLGSSGKLTAQINNGAPYGLFMSANMNYPQALYDSHIAVTKPVVYAQGALALFSVRKPDFTQGMGLLKEKNIVKIAIANPKTAPYGKASIEAMKKAGLYDAVHSKLVYAESISQTVTYAMTATEVGIIAKSSLYSKQMSSYKEGVDWVSVNPKLYTAINQGIVLLKYGQKNQSYKDFYDFILSEKAKVILRKYGYIIP